MVDLLIGQDETPARYHKSGGGTPLLPNGRTVEPGLAAW